MIVMGCGMFQVCIDEVYGIEAVCKYVGWFYICGCDGQGMVTMLSLAFSR